MDGKRKCSDFSITELITPPSGPDHHNVLMQHSDHNVPMDPEQHNAPGNNDHPKAHDGYDHPNVQISYGRTQVKDEYDHHKNGYDRTNVKNEYDHPKAQTDYDQHKAHNGYDHPNALVHRDDNYEAVERDYHNASLKHNASMQTTSDDWEERGEEEEDEEDIEVDVISMNGTGMFSPGSSSGGHSEESNEESSKNSSTADDDHSHKLSGDADDPNKKIYACTDCKYVTDRKNNLKRHIVTMHEECQKALECCDKVFPNKAAMREHVIACHKHGYDCKMCGRNFCRKALLKRHITVHSGQKDFICQVCGYATSHKSNLDRHKRRHLPKEGAVVVADKPMLHHGGSRDQLHHPHLQMRADFKPMHLPRDHPFHAMRFSHEQMLAMSRDPRAAMGFPRAHPAPNPTAPLNLSRDAAFRQQQQQSREHMRARLQQQQHHHHQQQQQQLPHIPYPSPIKTSPSPGEKLQNDRLALYLQDRYARFMDGKIAGNEQSNNEHKPPVNPLLRFPIDPVLSPPHVRSQAPDSHVTEQRRPYSCTMLPEIHLTNVVCVPPPPPPPSIKAPELDSAPSPTKTSSLEDEIEQFTYVVGDKEYLSYPLKKRKRLAPSLYTCKFCERVFSNQLQLNLHMEESHVIKKPEPQRHLTLSVNTQPKNGVCIFN